MISLHRTEARRAITQALFFTGISLAALATALITDGKLGVPSLSASPLLIIVLVFAFLAARLLTIRFPQGDEACVIVVVGLTALGVMDVGSVLFAAIVSGILDAIARFSQSSRTSTVLRVQDAVRSAAVLGFLSPWQLVLRPLLTNPESGDAILAAVCVAGISYALVDSITLAIHQRLAGGQPVGHGVIALLKSLFSVYLVHIAMAAVVLRVYSVLGLWAFAITLLLTLILQNSVSLYMRIRRAYSDTIAALAHAAELDSPEDAGHSRRVADMSIVVARSLGISGNALATVRYAALLHDIGRIGHADVRGVPEHYGRGAEIVSSIPFLVDVAPLLERQNDPDVSREQLGAAIIGVCSRYDRLRERHGGRVALSMLLADEHGVRREVTLALEKAVSRGRTGVSV